MSQKAENRVHLLYKHDLDAITEKNNKLFYGIEDHLVSMEKFHKTLSGFETDLDRKSKTMSEYNIQNGLFNQEIFDEQLLKNFIDCDLVLSKPCHWP
jgi:hypothetical protein